jgi:hypothetical protein
LLMLCSWYPLAHAAAQQLTGHTAFIPLVIVSGFIIALMWLPFGLALEALLRRWQNRGAAPAVKQGEEISVMKLIACCAAVLLLFAPARAQDKLEISLKNNSESESRTREELQKLLQEYDLSKWLFTRKILIEDKVIPHSHPVLTLSTRGEGDALLATFVHEQIHWFLVEHSERTEKAKAELRAMYPKVPVGPPDGARNEGSTYLHLIVNYLEYEAMTELIGEAKARKLLEGKGYYKWIYKTVLADTGRIKDVVERNKLKI